jgi:molybdopterin synthase catalytic subunit
MGADGIDIRLERGPLDVAAAVAAVTLPEAGGIDLFLGTTRREADPQRGDLIALDYHAYDEMAVRELRRLAEQARARWPVQRLAVWHRLGPVAVGEASVIVAASCPHRAEAFDACRFVIDELKKSVPIWKKEHYTRDSRWQGDADPAG